MARITAILSSLRAILTEHSAPGLALVSRRTTQPALHTVSFPALGRRAARPVERRLALVRPRKTEAHQEDGSKSAPPRRR